MEYSLLVFNSTGDYPVISAKMVHAEKKKRKKNW